MPATPFDNPRRTAPLAQPPGEETAIAVMLQQAGVKDLVVCDRKGILNGRTRSGLIEAKALRLMVARPIVFALANPTPEIMPEEAAAKAWIVATGRSDYPNQINNVLAFPGIFWGALNLRARHINEVMKLAVSARSRYCQQYGRPYCPWVAEIPSRI